MTIIKQRCLKEIREYRISFTYDDGQSGFCFPARPDGQIDKLNPEAYKNYVWCMEHPELFKEWNHFELQRRWVNDPAIGKCVCGQHVELVDQYQGAYQCSHCNRWYNLYGQALVDPEYWEEDDEDYYEQEYIGWED